MSHVNSHFIYGFRLTEKEELALQKRLEYLSECKNSGLLTKDELDVLSELERQRKNCSLYEHVMLDMCESLSDRNVGKIVQGNNGFLCYGVLLESCNSSSPTVQFFKNEKIINKAKASEPMILALRERIETLLGERLFFHNLEILIQSEVFEF